MYCTQEGKKVRAPREPWVWRGAAQSAVWYRCRGPGPGQARDLCGVGQDRHPQQRDLTGRVTFGSEGVRDLQVSSMGDWFCKMYLPGYENSGFPGEDGKFILFGMIELEISCWVELFRRRLDTLDTQRAWRE